MMENRTHKYAEDAFPLVKALLPGNDRAFPLLKVQLPSGD